MGLRIMPGNADYTGVMRFVLASLVFLITIPTAFAGAPNPRTNCKNTCSSSYTLCMKRSNTKIARSTCKQQNKSCKKGCKG